MTSAPIPANSAAYESANAQVTDWLDAEELVDIAAEVDDTLAAPEPDDEPLGDEGEFHAPHQRSFADSGIACRIATRRLENAARQEKQRQDPAYRKRAAEAFAAMEARRTAALAEADAKHNIQTKILTPSSVEDLMATHVTHLGETPALGWEDAKKPTMQILERFGMLRARRSGKAGLLYWHNDDRHSANKQDSSSPPHSKKQNDWNSVGCSAEHDAAHDQFWIDFLTWRMHNVYGESTFSSGDSLVQASWLALLPTLGVQTRTIPRIWPSWEKYKDLGGPETHGSVTLLASAQLDPAAVFPPGKDTFAFDDAADSFTYYTSYISHLSSPFYAAPDLSCGQLGRIQQIERTYEEVRLVLGDCSVEPGDAAYLSRVYMARCRVLSGGFTVPPEIQWALERRLVSDGQEEACDMNESELVAEAGSTHIAERLSEFAEQWKASGRAKIGKSLDPQGIVAMAIAGWKLSLQRGLERQPHCPLASVDSVSPICSPALGAAQLAAVTYCDQQLQADAGRGVQQAHPLTDRKSTSAISTPALSSVLDKVARDH